MKEQITYRKCVATWLRQQGHLVTTAVHNEHHSSIRFKVQGVDFTVRIDESDPGFVLLTHGFLLPQDLEQGPAVTSHALEIEKRLKVVKIQLDWENRTVEFNAEQFIPNRSFEPIFWRCVDVLGKAAYAFFSELSEISAKVAAHEFIDVLGRDLGINSGEQR